jgi:SAM-dependent methyltransferase
MDPQRNTGGNMQEEYSRKNEEAWNQMAYDAWICRFGTPFEAAQKLKIDPAARLGSLYKHLQDVKGKKIANLLGSNGNKAVALALLGGEVTVVDFSLENARYAEELAKESDVKIRYVISDVLKLPEEELSGDYDIVFTELGILHYFLDLRPFFQVVAALLRKGGSLVIQDFHPISTKLITSKGKKHKVTGDYFDESIEVADVAYLKYVPGIDKLSNTEREAFPKVHLRKWTLGEVVTAIAQEGLFINLLEEEESVKPDDKGIPKLFTVVAERI